MRRVFLLSAVLAGFASAAGAEEIDVTAMQLKACTVIKDEAARIRCYDRAMARPASEPEMRDLAARPPLVSIPQAPNAPPAVSVVPPSPQQRSVSVPPTAAPQAPQQPSPPQSSAPSRLSNVIPSAPAALPQSAAVNGIDAADAPAAKPKEPEGFGLGMITRAISPSGLNLFGNNVEAVWQLKADNHDLQQAIRLVATLKSADEKGTLVLECNNGSTQASISTFRLLGWETVRVLYRISEGQVTESHWSASKDGRAAVASNAVEFINILSDGGTLYVRLVDYSNANHDLKFNLGTVSNLRTQIGTVCRWPGAIAEEKPPAEPTPIARRSTTAKRKTPAGPSLPLH
jgi:hypothetical protein